MKNKWLQKKESTNISSADNEITNQKDTSEVFRKSVSDEMEIITKNANKIRKQNVLQAAFSRKKNERVLAENDIHISNTIKSVMDWMLILTSAEIIRKEEYDELTDRVLKFDEDINGQLELLVKFKRECEIMRAQEQRLRFYQGLSICSAVVAAVAIIIAIVL